jgi:Mrp family chromosome partitioning ATPase
VSKNYELLQQAQIGAAQLPGLRETANAAADRGNTLEGTAEQRMAQPAIRAEATKLVQRLFLTLADATPKVVTFAAVDSGDGCNWLCATAARVLAESVPGSVCLVEADFRAPSLSLTLGLANGCGLVDALREEGPVKAWAKRIGPENLWLISSGAIAEDSLSLFNGDRMVQRIRELRSEFDYLVIAAPPLSAYADGMVLGRLSDGLVLVLEANATRREAARRVTESLRSSNIPVLGAVLNNRTFPIPAVLYKRI